MKRYLVTGGAGFIGANFVKYLVDAYGSDVEILILDKLTYAGHTETICHELALPNVRLVVGDINDRELVDGIFDEFEPDYVVNFAAESHVDRSISDPRPFLETNIMGAQTLLEAAREAWALAGGGFAAGKKFLQVSTDEVYGSLARSADAPLMVDAAGIPPEVTGGRDAVKVFGHDFFAEDTPLAPRSPYSASKTAADMMALAYSHTYGLPVNVTRCSNNYGPWQFPEKLIPLAVNHIVQGKKIPVYARGENVRDWLHVTDHCRAIDMVLTTAPAGEVYNIGGFNEQQNIDVVKALIAAVRRLVETDPSYRQALGVDPADINESLIEYVADRPGHDMRYAIDSRKIARDLGWYPLTPFEKGIAETVKWCLDNRRWAADVTVGTSQFL